MSSIIKREYLEAIIVFIGLVIAFCVVFATMPRKGDVVVIRCDLAEISPDFTNEMREACRQARANNISK